jgi:hypothetical protein
MFFEGLDIHNMNKIQEPKIRFISKKIIWLFSNGSSASDGTSFHSYFVTKKVKTGVKRSHTGSQIYIS